MQNWKIRFAYDIMYSMCRFVLLALKVSPFSNSFAESLSKLPDVGSFPLFPPPPVEAVAAATSVFIEYVFCTAVDSAHKSHVPSKKLTAC